MGALDFSQFSKRLKQAKVIAVIGATVHKEKYGYKIFRGLLEAGFKVIPVNPKYKEIDGVKSVSDISSLEENPDVFVFVVPPVVTNAILKSLNTAGGKDRFGSVLLWFQPGAYDEETQKILSTTPFDYVLGFCIMKDFLHKLRKSE